jgi:hypothetical protein
MKVNKYTTAIVLIIVFALGGFVIGTQMCPDCVLDCTKCPVQIKEVEVFKYKHVCFNGSVVDFKETCFTVEKLPVYPNLTTTNEEGTYIDKVEVRPTCISGYKGGIIQYKLKTLAANVTAQIKHGDGEWEDVFKTQASFNDFIDFAICPKKRCFKGDFELKPDTAYLARLKFEARENVGGLAYSNEHIIDTTEVSPYTQTECATATYYR